MTLAKVKEQNGMTLAKVKEQEWACDSCKSKGTRVGMTLAKVKGTRVGMTLAKVKHEQQL